MALAALLLSLAGCGADAAPAASSGSDAAADATPSANADGTAAEGLVGADAAPETAADGTPAADSGSSDQMDADADASGDTAADGLSSDAGPDAAGADGILADDGTAGDSAPVDSDPTDSDPADSDAADTDPADSDPADSSDAGPPVLQPDPATLGPPVPAQIEVLWAVQPSFAAAGDGAVVLAQAGTVTAFLDQAGLPPVALQGDPGPARALAVMPGPQYLLATSKGLYGLQAKKWGVSPVQPWIGAKPEWLLVQPAAAGAGPWLWIGQAEGLWRHDGQLLQPVAVPDADLTAALLQPQLWSAGPAVAVTAAGQTAPKPTPALWMYANGAVRALTAAAKTAQVWHDQDLPPGKQLAGDGTDQLWWLNKDGTLHRRDPQGAWQWLALPEAVTAIAARREVPYSAVASAQGLWLQQQGVFFAVQGTAGLQLRGISTTGALLAVGKQGLVRVTPGQPTPPPPPSWAKDIQPLHNAKCGTCHGPAAVTVKLHTAALWQQWYAKIQTQLATDAMPLVGTKLTAAQKALVKAWAAGGYAP